MHGRMFIILVALLGLGGCGAVDSTTRSWAGALQTEPGKATSAQALQLDVQRVNVRVPPTLSVSESNGYFPLADIVWQEELTGDRYKQVGAIVQQAAEAAASGRIGGYPVVVDLQVTRFHALTQRARYTTGGVHNIAFYFSVLDAETGKFLAEPQLIETRLKALGGAQAVEAVSRGETQKVRIVAHLTHDRV